MPIKLAQIVDTLKLHIYHSDQTTQKTFNDYRSIVQKLNAQKQEAMNIHHDNSDMRFVNTEIGGLRFRVMAQTISGFAVTFKNADFSISLKSINPLKTDDQQEDKGEYIQLTPNPIMKVEFRSSYLVRRGHEQALSDVLKFIELFIIPDYKVKVSEIHLATDIQGHQFTILDYERFKTRKQSNQRHIEDQTNTSFYHKGRKFTGFTFGKGDEMLRIYNKTVEIKKNPDKAYIKDLVWNFADGYDDTEEVWRIEIQYRREKLKTIYDEKNGLLDGFRNVMDSIASLWQHALKRVEYIDLKDEWAFESMFGYRTINGTNYPIEVETIYQRITRASIHPLWDFIKDWTGYKARETSIYKAPKTGAFQWVSNSIKSLLSTLLKHEGDLTPETLEYAFERAETETIRDKRMSLIDNAYINSLDYMGKVQIEYEKNGIVHNVSDDLKNSLSRYINRIVTNVTNRSAFTLEDQKYKLSEIQKRMKRYVVRNSAIAIA